MFDSTSLEKIKKPIKDDGKDDKNNIITSGSLSDVVTDFLNKEFKKEDGKSKNKKPLFILTVGKEEDIQGSLEAIGNVPNKNDILIYMPAIETISIGRFNDYVQIKGIKVVNDVNDIGKWL